MLPAPCNRRHNRDAAVVGSDSPGRRCQYGACGRVHPQIKQRDFSVGYARESKFKRAPATIFKNPGPAPEFLFQGSTISQSLSGKHAPDLNLRSQKDPGERWLAAGVLRESVLRGPAG